MTYTETIISNNTKSDDIFGGSLKIFMKYSKHIINYYKYSY